MSKDDDKNIKLSDKDGAILFVKGSAKNGAQEFVIPEADDEWSAAVRETMAFFMYATQREDWINEFREKMDHMVQSLDLIDEAIKKEKVRNNLKLVDDEEEQEDD
tara:strand:+ start:235 stop:549 length:315 start_codon:yes stop_codon:yes gene_type:complete